MQFLNTCYPLHLTPLTHGNRPGLALSDPVVGTRISSPDLSERKHFNNLNRALKMHSQRSEQPPPELIYRLTRISELLLQRIQRSRATGLSWSWGHSLHGGSTEARPRRRLSRLLLRGRAGERALPALVLRNAKGQRAHPQGWRQTKAGGRCLPRSTAWSGTPCWTER